MSENNKKPTLSEVDKRYLNYIFKIPTLYSGYDYSVTNIESVLAHENEIVEYLDDKYSAIENPCRALLKLFSHVGCNLKNKNLKFVELIPSNLGKDFDGFYIKGKKKEPGTAVSDEARQFANTFNKCSIGIKEYTPYSKKVHYTDCIVFLLAYVYMYGRHYDEFSHRGFASYKSRRKTTPKSKYSYAKLVKTVFNFFDENYFKRTDLSDRMFGVAQLRKIDKQFFIFKICRMNFIRNDIINQEVQSVNDKKHYKYLGCKTTKDIEESWNKIFEDKDFISICINANYQDPFGKLYDIWQKRVDFLKLYIDIKEKELNENKTNESESDEIAIMPEEYNLDFLLKTCRDQTISILKLIDKRTDFALEEGLTDDINTMRSLVSNSKNKQMIKLIEDIYKKVHTLRFSSIDSFVYNVNNFSSNNYGSDSETQSCLSRMIEIICTYPDASSYLLKLKSANVNEITEAEKNDKHSFWRDYYLNNREPLNDFIYYYGDPEHSDSESFENKYPYLNYLLNIVIKDLSKRLTVEESLC